MPQIWQSNPPEKRREADQSDGMHFEARSLCVHVCVHLFVCMPVNRPPYLPARLSLCAMVHLAPHSKKQSGWCYKSHLNSSVKGIECPPPDRAFQKSSGVPTLICARRTKRSSVSYKVAFSIKAKGHNPDLYSKSYVH